MKYLILLAMSLPILIGCSKNDSSDELNCELYDPAFPSLNVRLVDSAGNNLIENGTIDPNFISVEGNFLGAGFRFNPANEFAVPDAEIRQFDNTIGLFLPYQSEFQYSVRVGDTQTVNIDFSAALKNIPCDLSYFKPNGAIYNNENLPITEFSIIQLLVVLEL